MGRRMKRSKRRSYSRSKSRMGKRISAKRTRRIRRKNTRRKNTRRRVKYGGIYLGAERPESCDNEDGPGCVRIDSISDWDEDIHGEWGGKGFYSKEAGPSELAAARFAAKDATGLIEARESEDYNWQGRSSVEPTTGGTQKRLGASDDDATAPLPAWQLRRAARLPSIEAMKAQDEAEIAGGTELISRKPPVAPQSERGYFIDIVYTADQVVRPGFTGLAFGEKAADYPIVQRFAGQKANYDREQLDKLSTVTSSKSILMKGDGVWLKDDISKLKQLMAERKKSKEPLTLTFFVPASKEGKKWALSESDTVPRRDS